MEVGTRVETTTAVPVDVPEVEEAELSDEEWALILLERAADRVEEGWIQRNYAGFGRVCAVGAIGSVIRHDERFPKGRRVWIRRTAERKLAKKVGPSSYDAKGAIIAWNDNPERTKEQVVRAFREAAAE